MNPFAMPAVSNPSPVLSPTRESLGHWVRLLVGLTTLLAFLAASVAGAQLSEAPPPKPKFRAKLFKKLERCLTHQAYAYNTDFSDWPRRLEAQREVLAETKTAGEFTRALNRVLSTYGVSHLFVLDPTISTLRDAGYEIGAGFRTVPNPSAAGRLVNVVIPGGPAQRIGLRKGDLIIEVDGQAVDPEALDYPFSPGGRLLGRANTERRLRWTRNGQSQEAAVGFERHLGALPTALSWPDPETAWVTLNSFSQASYPPEKIEAFFREIEAKQADYLVLDLRGNGGGRADNTNHLASFLLEPGTVMTRTFRSDPGVLPGGSLARVGEVERLTVDRGSQRFEGELAILIDRGSGSGGDAFPGLMQQVRGALLVGERTAGSLIGGGVFDLGKGYRLVYPFQERLLPDGTRLEGVGVTPDIALGPVKTIDDAHIASVTFEALRARVQARSTAADS